MHRAGGRRVGIKPSGGIRTFEDALGYLSIADDVMGPGWATPSTFRFGASGLLDALLESADAGWMSAGCRLDEIDPA